MVNYAVQNTSLKATLLHLDATVWNLPSNSIQICQSCDLFVILMIKNAWTRSWVQKKLHLIIVNEWMGDDLWGSSGALRNPRKPHFLQLVANAIEHVTTQRDNRVWPPLMQKIWITQLWSFAPSQRNSC